jgi:uncharacterized protein (TIRG00374 family)
VLLTVANIVVYVWPYQAALPGIGYWPGICRQKHIVCHQQRRTGGRTSGLAVQYKMLGDHGLGSGPATAAIGITSVWNTLVTLGLPVLTVTILIVVADVEAWVVSAAVVGLIAVGLAVGLLMLVFRSESAARRVGEVADGLASRLARMVRNEVDLDLVTKLLSFRASSIDVINEGAWGITLTNVFQQLTQFAVLFIALRGIQADVAVQTAAAEAFVAFSDGRLGSSISLTPGGLGTVGALITGILVGFGALKANALAATLVWRAATFFPQILLGVGTFLF